MSALSNMRRIAKSAVPASVRTTLRDMQERAQPFLYAGWSVECPCCGAHFREFLPHGRPLRQNARCGRCDAVERHRVMMLYLQNRTDLFTAKQKLLHFAPERIMREIFSATPTLQYVTTDYCEPTDVHMDITSLAIPDNTFDAVICSHVLEHIPDDAKAMRELCRVLKPGGWAILQVPIDLKRDHTYEDFTITTPAERRLHFGQEDHVRWYGSDYPQRLKTAGFDVTVDQFVPSLPAETIAKYGLLTSEDVYFCRKPA